MILMQYREIVKKDSTELHKLIEEILNDVNTLNDKLSTEYTETINLINKDSEIKRKYGIEYSQYKEVDTFVLNLKLKTLSPIIDELRNIRNQLQQTDGKALELMLRGEQNE